MGDKIGIMGAGALGSYVGAFLSKIGEDVTFVDMWPEHVEKMRADGLHVTGSHFADAVFYQRLFKMTIRYMGIVRTTIFQKKYPNISIGEKLYLLRNLSLFAEAVKKINIE